MFKRILYICLFLINCVMAWPQTIDSLVSHALRFNEVLPQENVYLHFDNTGYFMGETIWYKAYVVSSDSNKYTSKSGVLYVELLDPMGHIASTSKLEIKNGQAEGSFDLSELYVSGFYEIRAYTRYMLNWGDNTIFSRIFPVFKQPKEAGDYSQHVIERFDSNNIIPNNRVAQISSETATTHRIGRKISAQLYPEGGNLVIGLKSRVAFDITSSDGTHAEAEGVIVHENNVIDTFYTDSHGRGVFEYTPIDSEAYVLLKDKANNTTKIPLPKANPDGCVMTINTVDNDTLVNVGIQFSSACQGKLYGLILSNNGKIFHTDSIYTDSAAVSLYFSKKTMPAGVNEITLFDTSGKILSDRLFYIWSNDSHRQIRASIANQYLMPYSNITINFSTPEPNMIFSLAVRDADSQVNGSYGNAATWLLLGSQLKGFIENPEYYLECDDKSHRHAADLLTMIQGWRKFDFEMMNGVNPIHIKQPAEKQMLLMGRLYKNKKKDDIAFADLHITLYSKTDDVLVGVTETNEKGYYCFALPQCYGPWDLVMRTRKNDKFTNFKIGINRNFSPLPRYVSSIERQTIPIDTPKIVLEERNDDSWKMRFANSITLPEIIIKTRHKFGFNGWDNEQYIAKHADMHFDCRNEVDRIIDLGEDMPTLLEWLKKKVPYINGNDNLSGLPNVRGLSNKMHSDGPAYRNMPIMWYVDGRLIAGTNMPARMIPDNEVSLDPDFFLQYDLGEFPVFLDEVKTVYIYDKSPISSFELQKSVSISIYTYYDKNRSKNKGQRRTHYDGFNIPTTFSPPDYSVMPPEPDFRRTLYWNPNVTTDENGIAKISFDNNTTCKQLYISAEAITPDGKALIY